MFRTPRLISTVTGVAAAVVLIGSTATLAASAGPQPSPAIRGEGSVSAIPGSYLVKLRDTASVRREGITTRARALNDAHRGTLGAVMRHALGGFTTTMTREQASRLATEPDVEYVVQDQQLASGDVGPARGTAGISPDGTQTPVSWGLDRIDQHALPLDNHYSYDDSAGQGTHVYILSTGITVSHPDFGGRAIGGGNFVTDGRPSSSDCHGAGTRLAGMVGGTQFGVAKQVSLVGVRISTCNNIITLSTVASGFDWVVGNAATPAIVLFTVLPYCVDPQTGKPLPCAPGVPETMVSIQEDAFAAGILVFGMAGDSAQDTCANATGAAPDTVYVGATTSTDARAAFSNFGPCVTMFAPGEGISTDDPAGTFVVSSSGAGAAFVAGAAALFAGKPEFAGASPAQVRDELVRNRSTPNVVTGLTPNTPNRLLFTGPPGFYTIGDSAALAPANDGKLELFGVNAGSWLFHRQQAAAGSSSWSVWTQSTTKGWLSVGAEPNADGRLALLGLTQSGELWIREEAAVNSNTWYNWSRLGSTTTPGPIGRAVMAYNLSNRLQVFATNHNGQAFYRSQLSPGSRLWTAWIPFSFSGKLRSITAVRHGDGRIEVLALDDSGQVWRTAQTTPTDTTWSSFTKLNGFGVAQIAAARNANGTLELFGVDAGGGAWRRTRTSAGTWGGWFALNPKTLSRVTAETNANGRIHIVGVDNRGNVWQTVQTSANAGTYTPWSQLDGVLRP